ncbi:MAG: putative sugar nucleotidyl transferase [Parafilimonas sp.]
MAIVLFDNSNRESLYPLTRTKAMADLRCGIFTMKDRWETKTKVAVFIHTAQYLCGLYKFIPQDELLWIDAAVFADDELTDKIFSLENGVAIADAKGLIAGRLQMPASSFSAENALQYFETIIDVADTNRLEYPWQLFHWNDEMLRKDFAAITKNRTSQQLNDSNKLINEENIFIEDGADINFTIINASAGPVYIGRNTTIMEGCLIRGPFAMCEGSVLKMGAKIYGTTTLGPYCTVGGEIKNVVMQAYSNKAHDGYLGDSVIAEWCNLGAGTSNSNVKNTGKNIFIWDEVNKNFIDAGMKCGMIMGDYSRTAINSSLNTGTVIGVCCNVFGEGLLPKRIPDFNWGTKAICLYEFDKAIEDIQRWKEMKQQSVTDAERDILKYIFEQVSGKTEIKTSQVF